MGISRASRYKRRLTGGRVNIHQKKRKHEMGRPAANTKLAPKRISIVRVRGGNLKYRALSLESGNFSWGTEATTRKTRILDVVYNSSNNELVRTKTLVKGAIIQIDGTPFRQWYEQHYNTTLGKKTRTQLQAEGEKKTGDEKSDAPQKKSHKLIKTITRRNKDHTLEPALKEQFLSGRLYAVIASRPGQSGRCDGYVLEDKELEFYLRKLQKKK